MPAAAPGSPEQILLSDGYASRAVRFDPRPAPGESARRAVLYLHGIQSHGGWFTRSAAALAENGRPVLLPDRRGSGANALDRGHARSAARLLDDGQVYLERAAGLAGGRAVHLLGVSWGGKWALALAGRFPDHVASLVLSTPGCYAQRTLGPLTRLAVAACAAVRPRRTFPIPLNEPELFTDVEQHRRFIAADPLRLRRATARFLFVSHLMERRQRRWAGRVRCPVLLLLADRDPIIDNARTQALLEDNLPGGLLTVKRFSSAVHTLEFGADPSEYFRTLGQWMNDHD